MPPDLHFWNLNMAYTKAIHPPVFLFWYSVIHDTSKSVLERPQHRNVVLMSDRALEFRYFAYGKVHQNTAKIATKMHAREQGIHRRCCGVTHYTLLRKVVWQGTPLHTAKHPKYGKTDLRKAAIWHYNANAYSIAVLRSLFNATAPSAMTPLS